MADLINRQDAIDVLEERLQANGYSIIASELNRCIGYLMKLPSAKSKLKHGRWIERWHENKHVIGDMACSVCGAQMLLAFSRFCPFCGAKMDEEEEKEPEDV